MAKSLNCAIWQLAIPRTLGAPLGPNLGSPRRMPPSYLEPAGTKYPMPPDRPAPFPDRAPWDTPISELPFWLEIKCQCGRSTAYPLRLLAARVGWKKTLRSIVPRLKCEAEECQQRPERVRLSADGTGESVKSYSGPPKLLVLVEGGKIV